jgi:hypothetical protein
MLNPTTVQTVLDTHKQEIEALFGGPISFLISPGSTTWHQGIYVGLRCTQGRDVYRWPATFAHFHLSEVAELPGVIFSGGAWVTPKYTKRGIGSLLNKIRIEIGRSCGASLLLCTARQDNTPQRKVLIKNGWQHLMKFTNRGTSEKVFLAAYDLSQEQSDGTV